VADTKDPKALASLAEGLFKVAERLEPAEAARLRSQAVAILTRALAVTKDADALSRLAEGLSKVAENLEPAEAVAIFTRALAVTKNAYGLSSLAEGLSKVAERLEPAEAARLRSQAIATFVQAMGWAWHDSLPSMSRTLAVMLVRVESPEFSQRSAAIVAAFNPWIRTGNPLAAPALLRPALEPLPCRLSTPQLVELLKHPTCIGSARRVVLDQLENRYQRKFADHWAFVRFAKEQELEQKLGFDFTTPPKRSVLPASEPK
jgi:hypothetical protein